MNVTGESRPLKGGKEYHPDGRKWRTKEPLDESERGEWKSWLKTQHSEKTKTSQFERKSVLNTLWKEWYWSWSSNTLATWCEELTRWKRPWCWKRLKAGEEGDDRGWDGWMASPTWWTWVWANSRSWWWTGRPGVLRSMGSQRFRHDWVTELIRSTKAWGWVCHLKECSRKALLRWHLSKKLR